MAEKVFQGRFRDYGRRVVANGCYAIATARDAAHHFVARRGLDDHAHPHGEAWDTVTAELRRARKPDAWFLSDIENSRTCRSPREIERRATTGTPSGAQRGSEPCACGAQTPRSGVDVLRVSTQSAPAAKIAT